MKTVVITGSTRGIGYGMAHELLKRGHQVVISGRSQKSVDEALANLTQNHDAAKMFGQPCDVTDYAQVQNLWDASVERFGKVDIWVNNAGISQPPRPSWEQTPEQVAAIMETDLIGTIYGSQVAFKGMREQGGYIYNMEGFGSRGQVRPNLAIYGAAKRGMTYFTDALQKEAKETPVKIGSISPGMVVTDLLLYGYDEEEQERTKRIFNILSDKVETVTPYLVEEILQNEQDGKRINWLTTPKIIWRFMTARFMPRNVIE